MGTGDWNTGVLECWGIADPVLHHSITPTLQALFHAFGARSLITSRALIPFAISLYFCVRSMVAWRSFSEMVFSNPGKPIFAARSGFKPAHLIIAARLSSGSA